MSGQKITLVLRHLIVSAGLARVCERTSRKSLRFMDLLGASSGENWGDDDTGSCSSAFAAGPSSISKRDPQSASRHSLSRRLAAPGYVRLAHGLHGSTYRDVRIRYRGICE